MDDRGFDDLARSMTGVASRRTMMRRLAAAALGSLGLGRATRALAQDEDDDTIIDIHTGNGGSADAEAGGGDVTGGDINTGGNRGDQVTVGDTVAGEGDATVTVGSDSEPADTDGADANVVVDGGDVTTTTEIEISADGGTANATANGGSNNSVDVEVVIEGEGDPCTGVVCSQCQACDPETGACVAAREGGACRNANACTTGDTCQGGICVAGDRKACDECFDCDPDTGNCRPTPGAPCTTSISGNPTPGVCVPFGGPVGIVCCPGGSAFVRLAHARRAMLGQ